MPYMKTEDGISGKAGRAFITISGSVYEAFFAKSIEATLTFKKSAQQSIGRRVEGQKVVGSSGAGTLTLNYVTPIFRAAAASYRTTGVMPYFSLQVVNDDQQSAAGKQTMMLKSCSMDSVLLTKLDGTSDDSLEEQVPFTFEDFEEINSFTAITPA